MDNEGRIIGILCSGEDITERKQPNQREHSRIRLEQLNLLHNLY